MNMDSVGRAQNQTAVRSKDSVAYWGYKVMKRAAAVQQIRVKEKVSYAEAARTS